MFSNEKYRHLYFKVHFQNGQVRLLVNYSPTNSKTAKINHFRILETSYIHRMNWKISIQEKLLKLYKISVYEASPTSSLALVTEAMRISRLAVKWENFNEPLFDSILRLHPQSHQYFVQISYILENLHSQGGMAVWFDSVISSVKKALFSRYCQTWEQYADKIAAPTVTRIQWMRNEQKSRVPVKVIM